MRIPLTILSLGLLFACSGSENAPPDAGRAAATPAPNPAGTAKPDSSAAGEVAAAADSDSVRVAAAIKTDSGGKPVKSPPDSAVILTSSVQLKARTFRDSFTMVAAIRSAFKNPGWPVKTAPPLPASLLPNKRIVAFYGNPLSKKMGILGELPRDDMLAKLDQVVAEWRQADPSTPVQPALHLIVSVAQGEPGKDGKYRQRSDTGLISKVYGWAKQKNAVLFLDIQAGQSTIDSEMPRLIPFLKNPDVHLGLDPEFYMHYSREGAKPGAKIGTMDAKDVNHAIDELAKLVTQYSLPPKVLIVHRFTTNMLQGASRIKLDPRVQVVVNMDGWGQPWLKFDTYRATTVAEPVQFTGFKLFFHNDTKKGDPLLTAREVLALRPRPLYIQYQ